MYINYKKFKFMYNFKEIQPVLKVPKIRNTKACLEILGNNQTLNQIMMKLHTFFKKFLK